MRAGGVDVGPDEADVDHATVNGVLSVELPASVLELADLGCWIDEAVGTVGPVDAPLAGFRIVEPGGQSLDVNVLRRSVHQEFLDFRVAVPDSAADGRAVELHPLVGPG